MVGLVLVSHSPDLARGLRDLLLQMEPDATVAVAGGTDDGEIGTSLDLINGALDDADDGDGAVVLYDLGSAEMTADAALEFLDDDRRARMALVDAPLVEGALAAVAAAAGGADVGQVAAAARGAADAWADDGDAPTDADGDTSGDDGDDGDSADGTAAATDDDAPDARATFELFNTSGLHARPAALLVRAVRGLDAAVSVGVVGGERRANATSALALVALGATAGSHIEVHASGPQAGEAIDAVRELVEDGFGEPPADGTDRG